MSRISPGPIVVEFVGRAPLLARRGMTGATGNIYVGLHDFEDTSFVAHVLRPDELCIDVGANIGSYTILAASVPGARCVSFEPVPATFAAIQENVRLNDLSGHVDLRPVAVGAAQGTMRMTMGYDTGNHVATAGDDQTADVPIVSLDDATGDIASTCLLKIDVEGFETELLSGARGILGNPMLLAVLMETNQSGDAYGERGDTAHQHLLARGVRPFTCSPFDRRLHGLGDRSTPYGNTIYVRDTTAVAARLTAAATFDVIGISL